MGGEPAYESSKEVERCRKLLRPAGEPSTGALPTGGPSARAREAGHLNELLEWQKASHKTPWVLGEPIRR